MSQPRPAVLLYDWDNTLVDGWAAITAALNAVFTEFNHPLWSVEDTRIASASPCAKVFR